MIKMLHFQKICNNICNYQWIALALYHKIARGIKGIKNYFDNYKGDVESPEFVLNGGQKMKAWVDLQLNQMRANIKMTKMNRTNAGETNQFIDDHEKEGIIRPSQTHRKTVERHATSIPKFPKITEEINKIKKLIKY